TGSIPTRSGPGEASSPFHRGITRGPGALTCPAWVSRPAGRSDAGTTTCRPRLAIHGPIEGAPGLALRAHPEELVALAVEHEIALGPDPIENLSGQFVLDVENALAVGAEDVDVHVGVAVVAGFARKAQLGGQAHLDQQLQRV